MFTSTFKGYLVLEAEEADAIGNDSLRNKVKQVMRALTTLSGEDKFEERVKKGGGAYSELDLIEALNIVEEVARQRLAENPNQYKDDDKSGYNKLLSSIEGDIKDSLSTYFASSEKGGKGPRFVNMFNHHVVDAIIQAAKKVGPEQAMDMITKMVNDGKKAVRDLTMQTTADDVKVARNILNNYGRLRRQALGSKKPTQMSKADRLHLIAKVAQRVPGNDRTST